MKTTTLRKTTVLILSILLIICTSGISVSATESTMDECTISTPDEIAPLKTALDDNVSITGDIQLKLEETETNIYIGAVKLSSGTYKFNVNNSGTILGFSNTYTDTAVIDYSANYKAQSTLNATGGKYTFTFNTATNRLTIKFKTLEDIVELVGDINVELVRPKKTTTVFTGTVKLDAGTYSFNVNESGTLYGLDSTFEDVINENQCILSTPAKLIATGGIYSVKYDTATNKLKITHAPTELSGVTIFGDINLTLTDKGNGIYTAQKILLAGSYDIRVNSFGKIFGCGSAFRNTINAEFKSDWKANATFTVTSNKKFSFYFDTNTNKVKIFVSQINTSAIIVAFDNRASLALSGDINYTGTVILEAGTYTFTMERFGKPMGSTYTFTDNATRIGFNANNTSAVTFNATGGQYEFLFNTKQNILVVTKI